MIELYKLLSFVDGSTKRSFRRRRRASLSAHLFSQINNNRLKQRLHTDRHDEMSSSTADIHTDTTHTHTTSTTPPSRLSAWMDTLLGTWPFRLSSRYGTLKCPCGAVCFDLEVPPSSFGLVEQINALCHCDDCVGFAMKCPNGQAVLTTNYATHLVNFYYSDLHRRVVEKEDDTTDLKKKTHTNNDDDDDDTLRAVKLRADSPLVRVYCGECGTPVGADVPQAGMSLVYHNLITEYPVTFWPSLVLGFRDGHTARPSLTKPYAGASVTVRQSNVGPIFFWRVMTRFLLGWILGKGSGSAGGGGLLSNRHNNQDDEYNNNDSNEDRIPVGLETITVKID